MNYVRRATCRNCNYPLTEVLDLGMMPLANAFLAGEKLEAPEYQFPLSLAYCSDCFLVQVPDVVDPDLLFKDYVYTTGSSPVLVRHFEKLAGQVQKLLTEPTDLVVDIGGNDGTFLSFLKPFGAVLNVDPALNLKPLSHSKDVEFLHSFFNSVTAHEIVSKYGQAKVITATNAFAHSDYVEDMAKGVATLLRDDGVFIAEVHWVKDLIESGCWDQIYHEHLCYYSLHSFQELIRPYGLTVFDVEIIPTHGRSLRVSACKDPLRTWPSVEMILQTELRSGLTDVSTFLNFGQKVARNKDKLRRGLANLRQRGHKIAGYGAPAKGNVLLNYCKIYPHLVEYLVDSSPLKQGLYSPGTHIRVEKPEYLYANRPDYVLLLAWNYKDAILEKEQKLRDLGTKFIIPVPEVSIV